MYISHIRLTMRRMADEIKSPRLCQLVEDGEPIQCDRAAVVYLRQPPFLIFVMLHSVFLISFFSWLVCFSLIQLIHPIHLNPIIGPNYTVQGDQAQMEIKSIIR